MRHLGMLDGELIIREGCLFRERMLVVAPKVGWYLQLTLGPREVDGRGIEGRTSGPSHKSLYV